MSKQKFLFWADMVHPMVPPPRYFGCHPGYQAAFRRSSKKSRSVADRFRAMAGQEISVMTFADPRHPETVLVPRNRPLIATDGFHDPATPRLPFFFSSYDLWIDQDEQPLWQALHHPALFRMQGISELGALIPDFFDQAQYLYFIGMPFTHNRWSHLMLAAAMADVLLARSGWDIQRRAAPVLTVATHDLALPAGGDTVKRVDPPVLDEEAAYAETLAQWGLADGWRVRFNFDVTQASAWVRNEGMIGQLLDIVDKLSYVTYDCYYAGYATDGAIRRWCVRHPLVMNVWQDCGLSSDGTTWGFADAERLYHFLVLRALEHDELLLNPASRFLDTHLSTFVRPLYQRGVITAAMLRQWTDQELIWFLEKKYPTADVSLNSIEPAHFTWRRFASAHQRRGFIDQCGHPIDHTEDRTGFNSCIDWPVFTDRARSRWRPLHDCISQPRTDYLLHLSRRTAGYYAYWKRPAVS